MYICCVVFTPVNSPRALYVHWTFVQMMLIRSFRIIMYLCAVITSDSILYISIHMFYVYSLSCWNRTSVHTESFVATFSWDFSRCYKWTGWMDWITGTFLQFCSLLFHFQRIFGSWESKPAMLYFERCILYLRCCMWYFMVYFVIP